MNAVLASLPYVASTLQKGEASPTLFVKYTGTLPADDEEIVDGEEDDASYEELYDMYTVAPPLPPSACTGTFVCVRVRVRFVLLYCCSD